MTARWLRQVKAEVLREVAGIGAVDTATYLWLHDQANLIEQEWKRTGDIDADSRD